MTAVSKVAVVGAGVAGLAAAIQLAKNGLEVDVFERRPELNSRGSGISLQGNALRVFDALGVWEDIAAAGYPFEGLTLRAPGPGAVSIAELPEVKTGGPDYPAGMGMARPTLTRILFKHAVHAGARVSFAAEVTDLRQDDDGVELDVSGAVAGTYDLVVGADGLNSAVRGLIGIETRPESTGMGAWRAFVSRPADVVHTELYYGGQVYIAGYTPTGDDTMYAFLVEAAADKFGLTDEQGAQLMASESRAYDGPWNQIRADLEAGAPTNYTWLTHHIVPAPWNRGRVVIIGDAAHSCPPTIAQGAAQGLEDAWVLAELLQQYASLDQELWDQFHARRLPRAQAVVEASMQLAQWQIDGDRDADAGGLIFGLAHKMAEPA